MRTRTAALLVALAMAGCGSDAKPVKFAGGGTYSEPLLTDPGNLNPLIAQQNTTNEVVSFAYDTLINIDPHGRVVPQLAERWTVSPKRVTYTLRDGVTCADGTPLTARHRRRLPLRLTQPTRRWARAPMCR
jgi:peptide/nickel transport system substrate-binding protein